MVEFGELLRNSRVASGMSLGELARKINYSKSQVSKIENGHARAGRMFARLCDEALGTGGTLAAAVSPEPRKTESPPLDEVWVLELDETGSLQFTERPRSQIVAGAGAALGFASDRGRQPAIDDHTFALLRRSFDDHHVLGTMTSPKLVLGQVIAHLHTLRTLAVDQPEPMRSNLLMLAARAAEYAGWMSQEAGREGDALRWTDRAVLLAGERDPRLASFALFRHAEVALYQHNPVRTIELAKLAQRNQLAGTRILGLAARCEAQGHALRGDASAYEEALERAAELLANKEESPGPVLGPASVPDDLALVRGWSLYDLGRPGESAELLDHHLPEVPLSARRARARFGVRGALAHAVNGSPEQACAVAWDVLADVATVDSATIRLDLRELHRTLNRWRGLPDVLDLQSALLRLLY